MTSAAAAEARDGPAAADGVGARSDVLGVRTLLLGMGNPILSDDAIGIRLAQGLGPRLTTAAGLEILEECCTGGLELLDVVAGFDRLIVLDSIKTEGGRAGAWYRLDGADLRETMHLNNVHDANFATALELGRRMGLRLPDDDQIHILAVEVSDNATFSDRLSPPLEAAMPALVDEIRKEVQTILEGV